MAESDFDRSRGLGRSWNELALSDTNPVPDYLLEDHEIALGDEPLDVSRYVSRPFFDLEMERMWPRVWQFAAREEEFPEPGNTVHWRDDARPRREKRPAPNTEDPVGAFFHLALTAVTAGVV